jgi:hypothetical protein
VRSRTDFLTAFLAITQHKEELAELIEAGGIGVPFDGASTMLREPLLGHIHRKCWEAGWGGGLSQEQLCPALVGADLLNLWSEGENRYGKDSG